jgi:hypothetical protein
MDWIGEIVFIPSPTNHSPPSLENLDENSIKNTSYIQIYSAFFLLFSSRFTATYEK